MNDNGNLTFKQCQVIDQMAKEFSRPNYLQFYSFIALLILMLGGIAYITAVLPDNLRKQLGYINGSTHE